MCVGILTTVVTFFVYNRSRSLSVCLSFCWYLLHHSLLHSISCHFCHFLFLIPCWAGVPCSECGAGESRTESVSQLYEAVLIKKSLSESLLGFLPLSFPHSISSITASAFIFPVAISILSFSFVFCYSLLFFFSQPLPSCVYIKKQKGNKKLKWGKKQNSLI